MHRPTVTVSMSPKMGSQKDATLKGGENSKKKRGVEWCDVIAKGVRCISHSGYHGEKSLMLWCMSENCAVMQSSAHDIVKTKEKKKGKKTKGNPIDSRRQALVKLGVNMSEIATCSGT